MQISDTTKALFAKSQAAAERYADVRKHERSHRSAALSSASVVAFRKVVRSLVEDGFATHQQQIDAIWAMTNAD